ncbi:cupredoxin domain-containing protein [Actinocorallia populi]|uniref:hypothetical protein n=1 Tax=Actinocorallia populi TaxID=2079200 RepID=UPI000D088F20|nr:hypothetical protein [Actinocorallia populi]
MFRARALVPVVALSLFAAACGGEEKEAAPSAPSSAAPSATASETAAAPGTPSEPAFDGTLIKVDVNGNKVAPRPSTHKITKGDRVRIEVTSDKPDELHVHGYDNTADLKAGETAVIEFTADQSGRFEVETHDSGLLLFNLEVS